MELMKEFKEDFPLPFNYVAKYKLGEFYYSPHFIKIDTSIEDEFTLKVIISPCEKSKIFLVFKGEDRFLFKIVADFYGNTRTISCENIDLSLIDYITKQVPNITKYLNRLLFHYLDYSITTKRLT